MLVEGYGTASHPKVRVERAGFCSDSNVAAGPFIALVGTGSSNDAPRFAPDAVDPLVDYLTSRLFGNRFSAQKEDFAS